MRQVLAAPEYAPAHGVIHRGIKPSDVVVTPQGEAKVLDFGLAFGTTDASLLAPGARAGHSAYMLPEEVRTSK